MVLGRLDRQSPEKGSNRFPVNGRNSVVKRFFGVSTDNKVDEKLSIFIKPTVIF